MTLNIKVGICKEAKFVFNYETSFSIYLDFQLTDNACVSFYISDFQRAHEILLLLNKNKGGYAKHSINENDLKELIGKKANIQAGGWGSKCYLENWIKE